MEPTRRLQRTMVAADELHPPGAFEELEWAALDKVELTKNAKGDMQWSVSIHSVEADDAATKALEIHNRFETLFGHPKTE